MLLLLLLLPKDSHFLMVVNDNVVDIVDVVVVGCYCCFCCCYCSFWHTSIVFVVVFIIKFVVCCYHHNSCFCTLLYAYSPIKARYTATKVAREYLGWSSDAKTARKR